MPRHFQADVHPLRPQTAPLPIGPRNVAEVPAIALPPRFARAEPFVTQPLTKVPTVAQYDWLPNIAPDAVVLIYAPTPSFVTQPLTKVPTIAQYDWLPNAAPNAVALPHAPGDLFTAPAKFNISAPAVVSLEGFLGELAGPAKQFVFARAESFVTQPLTKVPTLPEYSWLPSIAAPGAIMLAHTAGDLFTAPAKFNISAAVTVSLAAFLGELAGPAKQFVFARAESFVTQPLTKVPTLDQYDWLPNIAPGALHLTYTPTPAFSAPDKFGIAVPAPPVLAGFLGEVAGPAKEFVFIQAEPFTAPGKVLPPAPITLNHWLSEVPPKSANVSRTAENVSQTQPFVSSSAVIVPLGWQTTTAPNAIQKSAARAPATVAPEKITIAIAPNTLDKWNQLEPPARYIARFARALELSGPDKTLPSLITNPLCAQSGAIRMSLEAQIALVRLALGSQSGRVRQALLAQGARVVMC
jgi:hypothetical protein